MNPQLEIKLLAGVTALYHVVMTLIAFIQLNTQIHVTLFLSLFLSLALKLCISLGVIYGIYHGKNGLRILWSGLSIIGLLSFVYTFSVGAVMWQHVFSLLLALVTVIILNRPHMVWYMDVQSEYERKVKN